jgi:hypothetical protein
MAWRTRHRLRYHPAAPVEHTCRQVARLPDGRRKGDADQRLRLLLDQRDQPVPDQLAAQAGKILPR